MALAETPILVAGDEQVALVAGAAVLAVGMAQLFTQYLIV